METVCVFTISQYIHYHHRTIGTNEQGHQPLDCSSNQ